MYSRIKKLWSFFDERTKIQFGLLIGLMLIAAAFETVGIGLILPLIQVIDNPGIINNNEWSQFAYQFVGAKTQDGFLLVLCLGIGLFYFVKTWPIVLMHYLQQRFVYSKRSSLAEKAFLMYLKAPYGIHLERNTAEFIRNLQYETVRVYVFVNSLLKVCTETFVAFLIVCLLIFADPLIFVCSILTVGITTLIFYKVTSKHIKKYGKIVQSSITEIGQAILEGFGAIVELKVLGREKIFPRKLYRHMMENARANWKQSTLTIVPRLLIETTTVTTLMGIIIFTIMLKTGNLRELLPSLGLFAVASIRLMPSATTIITNLQNLKFTGPAVDVIYEDFSMLSSEASIHDKRQSPEINQPFESLNLQNVSYFYPNSSKLAIRKISLFISKGESIALVGPTGSGKTTLVCLLLGLLEPTAGKIFNGEHDILQNLRAWRKNIGYVPQSTYMLDASIRQNIAFGLEADNINDSRVWEAVKIAQLKPLLEDLPGGLDTIIGENGVKFSGGQCQRLGIARSVYHQPEILILDEATSALDNETEKEVNLAINKLAGKKTLIIIAHRLSTVQKCDCIYFMKDGSLQDSGTFNELVARNQEFRKMAVIKENS
jgi:ATP-binding cassette, subfamily B, bacterial PglK